MPQRPASSWNTPRLRGRFQTQRFDVARRSSLLSCLRFPLWCSSDKYDYVFLRPAAYRWTCDRPGIRPSACLHCGNVSFEESEDSGLAEPARDCDWHSGRLSRQLATIEDGRSQLDMNSSRCGHPPVTFFAGLFGDPSQSGVLFR